MENKGLQKGVLNFPAYHQKLTNLLGKNNKTGVSVQVIEDCDRCLGEILHHSRYQCPYFYQDIIACFAV